MRNLKACLLALAVAIGFCLPASAQVDPLRDPPVATPRPANRAPAAPSAGIADLLEGLSWTCTDIDGDDLQYDVFFGVAGSDPGYVGTVTISDFAWPGVTLRAGDYQWRIEARDEHGLVTVGQTWSFSVLANGTISVMADASIWATVATVAITAESFEPEPGAISQGPLTGMTFAWIPSGSFEMGSPSSEANRDSDEGPVHTVQIQGFEMMTTEVTQGMWEQVMRSNPASRYGVGSSYPVYNVSWDDIQGFLYAINLNDTEYEYRLPSEAEWEYACRAGSTTAYYWGTAINGSFCWYSDNSDNTTHPVAQKLPNAWGLYDMSGNVWEWCEDWYQASYSGAPTDGSAWLSPAGSYRVSRGGSWGNSAQYGRSADRGNDGPGSSSIILGLRLARSVH